MSLYLMQHGEACTKDVDPERPLTDMGRADVERVALLLKQTGVGIDRILHSGKLRAAQTAQIITYVLAPSIELEVSGEINPNADPAAFRSDWNHRNVYKALFQKTLDGRGRGSCVACNPRTALFIHVDASRRPSYSGRVHGIESTSVPGYDSRDLAAGHRG